MRTPVRGVGGWGTAWTRWQRLSCAAPCQGCTTHRRALSRHGGGACLLSIRTASSATSLAGLPAHCNGAMRWRDWASLPGRVGVCRTQCLGNLYVPVLQRIFDMIKPLRTEWLGQVTSSPCRPLKHAQRTHVRHKADLVQPRRALQIEHALALSRADGCLPLLLWQHRLTLPVVGSRSA
jgi:hypothetical protein